MNNNLYTYDTDNYLIERFPQHNYDFDVNEDFLTTADLAKGTGTDVTDADEIQIALSAVTTGINAGQSPLQFMPAINTAQTYIGNRAVMHYVRRQYQQQVHDIAQDGFRDTPQAYPFREQIQQTFGEHHDISRLKAYTGTAAQAANAKLGSRAFHRSGQVAFAGQPTLKQAAHEAAHYAQNVSSEQLEGGIGEANDRYEQHADAVADQVVQGRSAASLLEQNPGESAGNTAVTHGAEAPVQMAGGNVLMRLAKLGLRGITPMGRRSASGKPPLITPAGNGKYSYKGIELVTPGYDPFESMIGRPRGPDGHTDYGYVQMRQARLKSAVEIAGNTGRSIKDILPHERVSMSMHSAIGVNRLNSLDRLLTERVHNPDKNLSVKAPPGATLYEGNQGDGRFYRTMNREVPTELEQKGGTYPVVTIAMPIENLDEILDMMVAGIMQQDLENQPYWKFEGDGKILTCFDYAIQVLRQMKFLQDTGIDVSEPGTLRENFRQFENLVEAGYMHFHDREDSADRIQVHDSALEHTFKLYFASRGEDLPIKFMLSLYQIDRKAA